MAETQLTDEKGRIYFHSLPSRQTQSVKHEFPHRVWCVAFEQTLKNTRTNRQTEKKHRVVHQNNHFKYFDI